MLGVAKTDSHVHVQCGAGARRRQGGVHQLAQLPQPAGQEHHVYLASAELAAIASRLGHIPTVAEYHAAIYVVNKDVSSISKYMNFDQIEEYAEAAKGVAAYIPLTASSKSPPWRALFHGASNGTNGSMGSMACQSASASS